MSDDKKAAKGAKDDAETETPAEGGEGEAAAEGEELDAGKIKKNKKKLIIIIAVATVLLLGGGGAGLYFTGVIGGHAKTAEGEAGEKAEKKEKDKDHKASFYDLGDMIVNLSGEGRRPAMLKIKMSIELDDEKDKLIMDQIKPRVMDNFQVYLRELRVEDLKGSAGIYRLREELLLRVAEAAHPAKVRDVLITEMLVQ